jgi:hypothetical protein
MARTGQLTGHAAAHGDARGTLTVTRPVVYQPRLGTAALVGAAAAVPILSWWSGHWHPPGVVQVVFSVVLGEIGVLAAIKLAKVVFETRTPSAR